MNEFQQTAHRKLRELAAEFQLDSYPLVESGNGVEYKNYANNTIFTVYQDRLDSVNEGQIEVAIGSDNIAEELKLELSMVQARVDQLQASHSTARSKGPHWWPRIALSSSSHISSFAQWLHVLYSIEVMAESGGESRLPRTQTASPVDECVLREIKTRRGQPSFRVALLKAYGRCAISRCEDHDALEAAHIRPHVQGEDYRTPNGLLLRADLHTLFDLRLISANPQTGIIVVSRNLGQTYQQYAGEPLQLPASPDDYPDPTALMEHFSQWETRENK